MMPQQPGQFPGYPGGPFFMPAPLGAPTPSSSSSSAAPAPGPPAAAFMPHPYAGVVPTAHELPGMPPPGAIPFLQAAPSMPPPNAVGLPPAPPFAYHLPPPPQYAADPNLPQHQHHHQIHHGGQLQQQQLQKNYIVRMTGGFEMKVDHDQAMQMQQQGFTVYKTDGIIGGTTTGQAAGVEEGREEILPVLGGGGGSSSSTAGAGTGTKKRGRPPKNDTGAEEQEKAATGAGEAAASKPKGKRGPYKKKGDKNTRYPVAVRNPTAVTKLEIDEHGNAQLTTGGAELATVNVATAAAEFSAQTTKNRLHRERLKQEREQQCAGSSSAANADHDIETWEESMAKWAPSEQLKRRVREKNAVLEKKRVRYIYGKLIRRPAAKLRKWIRLRLKEIAERGVRLEDDAHENAADAEKRNGSKKVSAPGRGGTEGDAGDVEMADANDEEGRLQPALSSAVLSRAQSHASAAMSKDQYPLDDKMKDMDPNFPLFAPREDDIIPSPSRGAAEKKSEVPAAQAVVAAAEVVDAKQVAKTYRQPPLGTHQKNRIFDMERRRCQPLIEIRQPKTCDYTPDALYYAHTNLMRKKRPLRKPVIAVTAESRPGPDVTRNPSDYCPPKRIGKQPIQIPDPKDLEVMSACMQMRDPLFGIRWLVSYKNDQVVFGRVCAIFQHREMGWKFYQVHWVTIDEYELHLQSRVLMLLRPEDREQLLGL